MRTKVRTQLREIELRAFWASNAPLRVLADKWHCTTACISMWARELGLPSRDYRKYQIRSCGYSHPLGESYVIHEATLRGITVEELEKRVFTAVIESKLIAAVLDDGDERSAA